tara:strand:+ start:931 stop:1890 length:960 start_codon:yes stop_codon:yes gene_type:complete
MTNIIYFSKFGLGLYYDDLRDAFINDESLNVFVYGPGYPNYSIEDNINDVIAKSFFDRVDLLFFSAGWDIDTSLDTVDPHPNINVTDSSIPKFYLLNKEYKKLKLRLEYAKINKFDLCFTAHHSYEKWGAETGLNFSRLPFAANEKLFKDYGLKKSIDLGFSGNLHNYKDSFKIKMMGEDFENIREKCISKISSSKQLERFNFFFTQSYLSGEGYAKTLNSSKLWLCTPSAIGLIGPRFYEIMGSKSVIFCPDSDLYEGLFEKERHCITFKQDLSDIEEKLLYFVEHDNQITNTADEAHKHFLKNHTWKNRIESIKVNL